MGKFAILGVAGLLLLLARTYANTNWDDLRIPFVPGDPAPSTPASVGNIGSIAEVKLPETDFAKWFPVEPPADPYGSAHWLEVDAYFAAARTPTGWSDACKKAGAAAGADRTAKPELGALGCSDDASLAQVQRFALQLLGIRAETALWIRGVPGHSNAGIQGRQGEARLMCSNDVIAREGGEASPFALACEKALDQSYMAGNGSATFAALGEAFTLIAAEIARRDPTIDPEPASFGGATAPAAARP